MSTVTSVEMIHPTINIIKQSGTEHLNCKVIAIKNSDNNEVYLHFANQSEFDAFKGLIGLLK